MADERTDEQEPSAWVLMSFRLPPELKERAEELARMDDRPLSSWIRRALQAAVEDQAQQPVAK